MKIKQLPRIFKYGSLRLDDPDGEMTPDHVKDFYALVYPELGQASIESSTTDEGMVYEFKKSYGTKGLKKTISVTELAKGGPVKGLPSSLEQGMVELMRHVVESLNAGQGGERIAAPGDAVGMI